MESNSAIFSTAIFGTGSGDTAANLIAKTTQVIESYYNNQGLTKLNNKKPIVPSNQKVAKGR